MHRAYGAAWSPDGRQIAFTRTRGPEGVPNQVNVMNADGSGQRRLARSGAAPRWSPDGRRIAFLGRYDLDFVHPGYRGYRDVYIMNADGSGQRRLTRTPRGIHVARFAWSPGANS